jgi:hypothetical protein
MRRWKKIVLAILVLVLLSQLPFAYRLYKIRRHHAAIEVLSSQRGADQIDDGFTESRRLEKAEANGGRICLPNDSEDWSSSIQFLAVEFDDIAVWVEDVDLRVARGGMGTKLHLSEVVVGNIVAEIFAAEPR